MSKDVDFKLQLPQDSSRNQAHKRRRKLRKDLAKHLCTAGFGMGEDLVVGNESSYFCFPLSYQSRFPSIEVLWPGIKLEFIVRTPRMSTSTVEVRSLLFEYLVQEELPIRLQAVNPLRDARGKDSGILAPHGHLSRQWLVQGTAPQPG